MPKPSPHTTFKHCIHHGCKAKFQDHAWGRTKAHKDDWFISKDEKHVWCPEHLPGWIQTWRKGKQTPKVE